MHWHLPLESKEEADNLNISDPFSGYSLISVALKKKERERDKAANPWDSLCLSTAALDR